MYKLTIIMAAYNSEDYIEEAIESFEKQSKSWVKLLVVNDGSTDDTRCIVERYAKINNNIKLINRCNGGLSAARNTGLEASLLDTEYVSFFDADDYLSKDYINNFNEAITKFPKVDIIEFNLQRFTGNGDNSGIVNICLNNNKLEMINEKLIKKMIGRYNFHSCGRFYKSSLFSSISFDVGRRYEDMLLTPRLYLMANKIFSLNHCLYFYRLNTNSITRNAKLSDVEDIIYGYNRFKISLKDYHYSLILLFKFKVIKHCFSVLLNFKCVNDVKVGLSILASSMNLPKCLIHSAYKIYCNLYYFSQSIKRN